MNRIRKVNNTFQVLITPDIKIAPDAPIMVGNWDDENLRNYSVIEYESLQDAQCEAFKYPDIDWYRFVTNHELIYRRLHSTIKQVIEKFNYVVELKPKLMTAFEFKNAMFDRVQNGGDRFNLRYNFTDIITFTIINPWSNVLHKVSKSLETAREHLYRDDLRIKEKKIIDGKIICLYGITEFGSIYEIKLVPTVLYQWSEWVRKNPQNINHAEAAYANLLKTQEVVDRGPVFI